MGFCYSYNEFCTNIFTILYWSSEYTKFCVMLDQWSNQYDLFIWANTCHWHWWRLYRAGNDRDRFSYCNSRGELGARMYPEFVCSI